MGLEGEGEREIERERGREERAGGYPPPTTGRRTDTPQVYH